MKLIFILIVSCLIFLDPTYGQECGKSKSPDGLIYGGKYIKPGQFPWIVPLFYKHNDGFFCNSNLISAQHLLTAAHCMHEKQATLPLSKEDMYAYLGRYDLTNTVVEPNSKQENIQNIVIHPKWNAKDVRYDADLAMLTLQNLAVFSDLIQPVCLPPPNLNAFVLRGKVVGWGQSETSGRHEIRPKQVEIPSYGNEDCFFTDYRFAQFGSPRTFCAGERGKTPCKGDSGGGYFILDTHSSWTLAGIVSAAIVQECGKNDFVLFTNVAKFTDWIESEVNKTYNKNSFESAFDAFDEDDGGLDSRIVNVDCKYKSSGNTYGCYINSLEAPDNEIDLKIVGGTHVGARTARDVSVMQIKGGHVPQFPDLTHVSNTFPNLDGFGITFTGLKKIERKNLKNLSQLKFFLISDNAIEEIPGDTFLDLKNLELIDICRNKVKRIEPTWLTSMPRLRVFKARDNQFQYVPGGMFQNNPQLEEILFDGNKIARNEVDYTALKRLKLVAILRNQCIDAEYCQDPNKPKCIRSLQQFNYLINGNCGVFN